MTTPNLKFNLPFNTGLSDTPPPTQDPVVQSIYNSFYNAFLQIQQSMHQYLGLGQQLQSLWDLLKYDQTLHQASVNRLYVKASETITYAQAINLHDNGGVLNVRLANATNNTKPCHGFCTTLAGIASGVSGEVILNFGLLTGITGVVRGTRYFLSTTNGLITATAPVAAGNIEQPLGLALDTVALHFGFGFGFIQH
jgi:hypothetical protein